MVSRPLPIYRRQPRASQNILAVPLVRTSQMNGEFCRASHRKESSGDALQFDTGVQWRFAGRPRTAIRQTRRMEWIWNDSVFKYVSCLEIRFPTCGSRPNEPRDAGVCRISRLGHAGDEKTGFACFITCLSRGSVEKVGRWVGKPVRIWDYATISCGFYANLFSPALRLVQKAPSQCDKPSTINTLVTSLAIRVTTWYQNARM